MALLTGDLAALVGSALNGLMLDGVLHRPVASSVDSHGSPLATYATYTFRGFRDDYTAAYRSQAGIPESDCRIMLTATSIAVAPQRDDKVVMSGVTYRVRAVSTDPATAMYDLQVFQAQ